MPINGLVPLEAVLVRGNWARPFRNNGCSLDPGKEHIEYLSYSGLKVDPF